MGDRCGRNLSSEEPVVITGGEGALLPTLLLFNNQKWEDDIEERSF